MPIIPTPASPMATGPVFLFSMQLVPAGQEIPAIAPSPVYATGDEGELTVIVLNALANLFQGKVL